MRVRDVLSSAIGLLLLAPLFLVIAVAIRMDSPGPVFFRQTRVGLHGRHFRIHKFRSMRVCEAGLSVSTAVDPRITRVGRILRRAKLDELPQLIDVLRGTMSLVGPRPEVPQYVDLWPRQLRPSILSVRPGITDPATVLLRSEAEILAASPDPERTYVEELLPLKATEYERYVRTRSFVGDTKIIVDTFAAIVTPTNVAGLPKDLEIR
jgi:lipopolysaccharide/colanic/teichoic acid biosynthesis glycosyltransferase